MAVGDVDHDKLSHLRACGVLDREAELVSRGADDNQTTLAVRDWAASEQGFCLLIGRTGSGKTIAAAESLLNARLAWMEGDAKRWCYTPAEAKFCRSSDLSRLGSYDAESIRKMNRLERVPWLVVDDLGAEFITDIWRQNLGDLIDARHSSKRLKTAITSNFDLDTLRTKYDERIISRIKGNGVVVFSGTEDMRQRKEGAKP